MRICHVSDIHWRGFQRHAEYTEVFEKTFELMRALEPDIIINTGDTFHTKTQNISPEVIDKLAWMIREMVSIAPTYTLLGNHDGNLANASRQDVISPIHKAMNLENHFLLKDSVQFQAKGFPFEFYAFSPFDKEGWSKLKPDPNKTNIALFHGSIAGSKTDGNFYFQHGEKTMAEFSGFDYLLLGDIHLSQFLGWRENKNKKSLPWAAYAGSLIQQNFGENEEKGFLVWDIEDKDDWSVQFCPVENPTPYITIDWNGSVEETIHTLKKKHPNLGPGSRMRIRHQSKISSLETQVLSNELKQSYKPLQISFQQLNVEKDLSAISTNNVQIQKSSLRNNPKVIHELFKEFILSNKDKYQLTQEQLEEGSIKVIQKYLAKLYASEPEATRDVCWSLKKLEFDNLFRYGKDNVLDFTKLSGLVGVFGPNRAGKSSIVGSLMYGLYNGSDRGPIKNAKILNRSENEGGAKVTIDINGVEYVIERKTERMVPKRKQDEDLTDKDREKSNTSLELYKMVLTEDGTVKPLSLTSINREDTDKEIRRLIGTAEDFLLTAFSSQGKINTFIEEGPTQRKKILSRFLDLDIFDKLHGYAKDDLTVLMDRCKNQDITKSKLEQVEKSEASFTEEMATLITQIETLAKLQEETEKELSEINTLELPDLGLHQQKIDKLENFKKEKLAIENELVSLADAHEAISADISAYEIQVKLFDFGELNEKFDIIKEKEKVLLDRVNEQKIKQASLENKEKSVKKLETVPCGDQFPSCRFIKDSHEDAKSIQIDRDKFNSLLEEVSDLQLFLKKNSRTEVEKEISKFEKITKTLESNRQKRLNLEQKNENALLRLSSLDEKIKSLELEVQKEKTTIETFDVDKISSLKSLSLEHKNKMANLLSKKEEMLVQRGGLQAQKQMLSEQVQSINDTINELKLQKALTDALSKTGVPSLILKTQLPAINNELQKLLMSIQEFNVSLDLDLSSNSMDVLIEDASGKREIELASGAEKMITSLALRVALLNLSSLPKPDILIIDEGFGSLDDDNLQKCMEFLDVLKAYFKSVIIITHVSPLKEVTDQLVEIVRDGHKSKVQN